MPKSSIEDQIQACVERFSVELSEMIRSAALDAVRDALSGPSTSNSVAPAKKKRGRPKGSKNVAGKTAKKKGKRIRRSESVLVELSGTILSYVRLNEGQGITEIADGIGIPLAGLKKPIKDMLAAKKLHKKGNKRATKYFAK